MSYSLSSSFGADAEAPQPPSGSREFRPGFGFLEIVGALILACVSAGVLALAWIVAGRNGFSQWGVLAFLGGAGLGAGILAGNWLARALDRSPVIRLTQKGLVSNQLQAPIRWYEVADVDLEPQGGRCALRLRLHARAGRPDRRSFWSGRNPAVPHVNLHRLSANERAQVLTMASAYVARDRALQGLGAMPSAALRKAAQAFDEQLERITPTPWSLVTLIGVNVAVWVAGVAAGFSVLRARPDQLFEWGANSASAVVLQGEWWRLLTATFLHGGILHLAFNMACLWFFGRLLLRLVGHGQFFLVYFASALCGSAASLHFSAQSAVSVGASGAVFGVLGALYACSRKYRDAVPEASTSKLKSGAAFFIFWSLAQGFGRQGTDNAAHVGGLLCGLMMGWLMLAVFDPQARVRMREASLGAFIAAVAVVMATVATPLPKVWHHELFGAMRSVQQLAPDFALLARILKDAQGERAGGRSPTVDSIRRLKAELAPVCQRIDSKLAGVQVPGTEPLGRFVAASRPICGLLAEALELERRVVAGETSAEAAAPRMAEMMRRIAEANAIMRDVMKPPAGSQKP